MERRKQSDRTLSWCGIVFLPLMTLGCSAEAPESLEGAARGAQQPLTSTSISSQISGGNDDAEERSSGTYLNSSDLELALDGSNEQLIGLRFTQGLNIPSNATITAAHIEFTVKNPSSSYTALTFFGQKEGDTGPFAMTQGNLFWRTELSSSKTQEVHWAYNGGSNDPSTGGAGSKFDSPDLSGIIQEIVDASTFWQPGQTPLLLYMVGNGSGFRRVWSYEGSAANAPVLHIEYTTPECTNGEVRQIPCGRG